MSCNIPYLWEIIKPPSDKSLGIYYDDDTPSNHYSVIQELKLGVYSHNLLQLIYGSTILALTLDNLLAQRYIECISGETDYDNDAIIDQIIASQNKLSNDIGNSTGTMLFGVQQYNNLTAFQIDNAELNIRGALSDATSEMLVNLLNQGNSIRFNIAYDNDITRDEINSAVYNTGSVINNNVMENNSRLNDLDMSINGLIGVTLAGFGDITDMFGDGIGGILGDALGSLTSGLDWVVKNILSPLLDFIRRITEAMEKIVTDLLSLPLKILSDIQGLWERITTGIVEGLEKEFNRWDKIRDRLLSGDFHTWDEMLAAFEEGTTNVDMLGFGLGLIQLIPFIFKISQLLMHPMVANLELLAQEKAGVALLGDGVLLESYKRGHIDIKTAIEQLGMSGYQEERIRILLLLTNQLLGVGEISQLFLRGNISEEMNDRKLENLGYNPEDRELLKELYNVLPGVQDLVLMAVREVFSPVIAEKFGLFEDFPPAFAENAAKIGLSDEWARNFWAAHWTLPSIMQGFFMMHRRVISQDELQMLLKAQDVMPFWRDKLVDISYNPLTRVDVRRMHKTGVLNRKQVYDAYLDVGFNPENAELMTEFTVRYNADDTEGGSSKLKELTRSVIQSAYKKGVISKVDAMARLQELGYGIADSQLLLDLLDYEEQLDLLPDERKEITNRLNTLTIRAYTSRAISKIEATDTLKDSGYTGVEIEALLTTADLEHDLDFKAELISQVKQLYFDETINILDLRVILETNDFIPDEIDMLIGELNVFKFLRGRKPTRADLRKAFNRGIYTVEEYAKELSGLGYPDKYVEVLMKIDGAIAME